MLCKRLLTRIVLPAILVLLTQTVFAQKVITGKVADSKDGSPVAGASVTPKGGSGGTTTGTDGTFRITVGDNVTTLVISYVGYAAQEVSISGKSSVDVNIVATGGANMNEVVVIGYGTARKKDLTGSVVTVTQKDFNQGPTTSPQQLIQGKVAGLEVTNSNGMPGAATTIRIRGNSTIRSGNNPLYVVDGVPLDGRVAKPGAGNLGLGNSPASDPLYFFNPNDISTISVLKDASATAIYGSRASNGVVMIETKKGIAGEPRLDVSTQVGFSDIMKKYKVLTGDEYRAELKARNITSGDYGSNVDGLQSILQTGWIQNYNLGISGGNENGKYRASFGYFDQDGIVKTSNLKRFTALLNGQYRLLPSRKLTLNFMVLASQVNERLAPVSNDAGASGNLISNALQWNPTLPLKRPDGSFWGQDNPTGATNPNPLSLLSEYDDRSNVSSVLAFAQLGYKLTDWLTFQTQLSVNHQTGERKAMVSDSAVFTGIYGKGAALVAESYLNTSVITNQLNFNKQLTSGFNLQGVLGYEYQKFSWRGNSTQTNGYSTPPVVNYSDIIQNVASGNVLVNSFYDPDSYLQSFFARAIGNFGDGRFIVTGTIRADGSSKFGADNRYGYFPSLAASWNVMNEKFMKSGHLFDALKLRAGWGITGNQEFPAGASQTQWTYGQGSIQQVNVANPALKWEQTKQWDVGVDWSVLNGKLSGTFDYFDKNTTDLLFNFEAIQPAPATRYWTNLPGNIKNNGFEFYIRAVLMERSNLTWDISVNGAFLHNVVENYNGPAVLTGALSGQGSSGATVQKLANGQPLNAFYTREFQGFDQNGVAIYRDNQALFFVGDPNPHFIGGLSSSLTTKKWTFALNISTSRGNKIYNETLNNVLNIGNLGTRNMAASLIGSKESPSNAVTSSSRFLEKADYIKFGNLSARYNVGNIGAIKGLYISVVGQNLFYITNFTGFSPEVNTDKQVNGVLSYGIEYIPYPTARTIQFGLGFSL
jgi:TonB-linked SusC/RagA family outer membrane protein